MKVCFLFAIRTLYCCTDFAKQSSNNVYYKPKEKTVMKTSWLLNPFPNEKN